MRSKFLHIVMLIVVTLVSATALAQNMPERGLVRKGNRLFNKERYAQSADAYQQALNHDETSFEARYNLGNALIRRAMADSTAYDDPNSPQAKLGAGFLSQAEGLLQEAAADSLRGADERADAYYNLGNSQFVQQKLQDALKSYRQSLVLRPDDKEAKYNYALTKKLLEQQQNQDQNQNQNQDQNQDQNNNQNQDQNNNQNQDNNQDNQNNQDNNQNQDQQGGGDDEQQQQQQPPQGQNKSRSGMSEEQQQQLLNAIQAQEDKTQEKLDEKKKGIIIRGKKNW